MSDQFRRDPSDDKPNDLAKPFTPLPSWLARRVLQPGEKVDWVCGPRFSPSWERYVTHPGLFLVALATAALVGWMGWRISETYAVETRTPTIAIAGGILIATIFVLGFFSGYFTRLVVTNRRIVILQGYEQVRSRALADLPPSLIRHRMGAGAEGLAVDLDSLTTMLGGSSTQFVDAKTILAFSKQLGKSKTRENDRPE
jgi:hypothetical protein